MNFRGIQNIKRNFEMIQSIYYMQVKKYQKRDYFSSIADSLNVLREVKS